MAPRRAELGYAVQPGGEHQVLVDIEFAVQRRGFRQIADVRFGRGGMLEQVDAADADGAGRRRKIAGQHLHRRGFAGAVGPEKAQHFAAPQFEADAVDCGMGAEVPA